MYNVICIKFDASKSFSKLNVSQIWICLYLDLSRWNVSQIICRFALVEVELRKPTVAEGRYVGFFAVAIGKEGDDGLFYFFFSRCVCLVNRIFWNLSVFFVSNTFFNSVSMLLNFFINWASEFARVLPNTYKPNHNETLFIFTVFVSMSRSRSIYVISVWRIFDFRLHFHYD